GHVVHKAMVMIRETSAVTARQNLGDLLNQVQYRNDSVLITKDGKPVAALIDVALFDRIRRLKAEFIRLTDALGKAYEGVDPAIAQAEIDEAVSAARKRRVKLGKRVKAKKL
ncbi:MAG: type II toxin-antitoxin system prevent-host-death family antitoxin, partial [Casimicrobiaceae bacterium]